MIKKIIIAILALLALVSCGAKSSVTNVSDADIQKLNKERGGLGIHYNYTGPNVDASTGKTQEQ